MSNTNTTIEEFHTKLKECGLSKKMFSEISRVNYGTILNWGTSRGEKKILTIPPWVLPFLNLYEESKKNP